jgi:hypothetical protein
MIERKILARRQQSSYKLVMRPCPPYGYGERRFSTRPFACTLHLAISLLLAFLANGGKAQEKPAPPPPPPDIRSWAFPANPSLDPSHGAAPITIQPIAPITPIIPIQPTSPEAQQAEAKLRTAQSEQTLKYQSVTLKQTSAIRRNSAGDYFSRAFFSVHDQGATIECISSVRAATVAFVEYIKRIFKDKRSADLSLEMIVAGARQFIGNRQGLSDAEITLHYIDQFGETHVVQIPRHQAGLMFAIR